jgi:phosphoribosylglycinamide formyltransferase-1
MRLALFTYAAPHSKTAELFFNLLRRGHEIIFVYTEFRDRIKRKVVFSHRPEQFVGPNIGILAAAYNVTAVTIDQWSSVKETVDYGLIGGSNLLPEEVASCGKIINCHPGIIPQSRGLDSFKWAIREMKPMGITLHFIDAAADAGTVIHIEETPVFVEDDISTFAERHYRNEIDVLSNFAVFLGHGRVREYEAGPQRMRMNAGEELLMLEQFDAYKARFAVK